MFHLDTTHPTIVHNDFLLDPSILDKLPSDGRLQNKKRNVVFYDYTDTLNPYLIFIRDVCSGFLELNNLKHNKHKWYTDVIRYHLNNDTKRVSSGLAWHCENDNYPDVITVLLYLHIDEGIIEGNIRYKDKNNIKRVLKVQSGTTVIMDGNVPHKPQDPYGSGKRDLIIMSFEKGINL